MSTLCPGNSVHVAPYSDTQWVVIEPYRYITTSVRPGFEIVVPFGFLTDGASVPRVLWPLIPPFGLHFNAAVVHDYLYSARPHILNKAEADIVFLEILQRDGVPEERVRRMYRAVAHFGFTSFFIGKAADNHIPPGACGSIPARPAGDLPHAPSFVGAVKEESGWCAPDSSTAPTHDLTHRDKTPGQRFGDDQAGRADEPAARGSTPEGEVTR